VAIGIMVVLLGASLIMATVITGGVLIGLFSAAAFTWPAMHYHEISVPLEVFTNSFSGWMVFAGFVAAIIPAILITLLGASIIAKKLILNPTVGWAMFVFFFVSVAMLSVSIPRIVYSFKEQGEFKVEEQIRLTGTTAVFHINEIGMDDYDAVSLTLRGHEGEDFKLVKTFRAQGVTKQNAIEHAQMISYNVDAVDSTITFDSNIQFNEGAIFRAQRLDMMLYIPFNHPFVLDESTSRFISQHVDYQYMDGNTWKMTANGLECVTCPKPENESTVADQFGLSDFDAIDLQGIFDVRIEQGREYAVELIGPESEKRKYNISRSGHTLIIDYEGSDKKFDWDSQILDLDEIRINITMPELEKIEAEGFGRIEFDKFNSDDLDIYMRGPVKLRGEIQGRDLVIDLTGKSEVELSGQVDNLDAELQFASKLRAYNLEVRDAIIEVNGASSAKVNVSGSLEIEEGIASDVDYRGNPSVIKRD
jgi:hypothetical protein